MIRNLMKKKYNHNIKDSISNKDNNNKYIDIYDKTKHKWKQ